MQELSRRSATQLRRSQPAEPHLCLLGTRKRCGACALKALCTSGAFRFLAIHMDEPARQRARELANTPEFAHAQRATKEGGSIIRGTQESARAASLAPAQIEVRARAVLPGSGPEHQATGPIPQFIHNTHCGSCFLTKGEEKLGRDPWQPKRHSQHGLFQDPRLITTTGKQRERRPSRCRFDGKKGALKGIVLPRRFCLASKTPPP